MVMKSEAGKVSVSLQMEFDIPTFQHQAPYRSGRNGPAKQRRRERRARERRAAVEETEAGIAPEEAVVLLLAEIAAKAGIEECEIGNPMSEEDLDEPSESSAVAVAEAPSEFKCQECESEFENSKELRNHDKRSHKVTNSPIPQIDGTNDASSLVTKENSELDKDNSDNDNKLSKEGNIEKDIIDNNNEAIG